MVNSAYNPPEHRYATLLIPERLCIWVGAEELETNQEWYNQVSGAQSGGAPLPPATAGWKVAKGDQERQQRRSALF